MSLPNSAALRALIKNITANSAAPAAGWEVLRALIKNITTNSAAPAASLCGTYYKNVCDYFYRGFFLVDFVVRILTSTSMWWTETVVKVIREIEPRFSQFDEMKLEQGKRDRAEQEIFLHENKVSLEALSLEELNQEWLKHHLPSLMKKKEGESLSIKSFMKKDISKVKFLETWMY